MAGDKSVILSVLGNNTKAKESIAQVSEDYKGLKEETEKPLEIGGSTKESQEQVDQLSEALEKYKVQAKEAVDAQAQLTKVQQDSKASDSELAAAQDRVTESAKAMKDATLELGKAELASSDEAKVAGARSTELAAKNDLAAASAKESSGHWGLLAAGLVVAGGVMVDMAAKFQEANTHLVTDAGESAGAMGKVAKGMLAISASTGTSAETVSQAMFTVESAGFHYANGGLTVMKAVAQGAKATGSNLGDMANAVTSALNAYGLKASSAGEVTSQLIATVSAGKMHMQDLATSISNVLPVASAAGISLGQVGGALATMTSMGMSADQASQNLANAIRNLIHPNAVASAEMQRLGLNVIDVEKHVGQRGLTGTLDMLTEAILRNTHGGSVIAGTYAHMSSETKGYAEAILNGSITTGELTKATKTLTPEQATLLAHFHSLAVSATGIKQTYAGALAAMTGGATGLNVALLLTGKHMGTFKGNVDSVTKAGKSNKALADDWAMSQANLSTQIDIAKTSVEDLGITVGMKLLPPITALIKPIASFVSFLVQMPGFAPVLITLAAVFVTLWTAVKLGTGAKEMFHGIEGAIKAFRGALMGATEAEGEATVAQEGLNLAFLASPITWIIIGIVALVVVFYELWKHVKGFRDFWKDAWHDISVAFDATRHFIAHAVDDIIHGFELFQHEISHVFDDVRHDLAQWVGDVVHFGGMVLTWFETLPKHIWHYLGDFGTLLISAGESLIHGLIGGVENEAGRLWGLIGSIGKKISHVFSDVLSIFSPSRVFMEHGKNIVLGLVAGINGYAHLADTSVSSLAQRAINASSGRFSATGSGSSGSQLTAQWVGGNGADQEFITWLKKNIRIRGGNPAVLGR